MTTIQEVELEMLRVKLEIAKCELRLFEIIVEEQEHFFRWIAERHTLE
jgi:hypothetical protein